ncbi:MAG: hypothetical protein WD066_20600 [Planctomycetaceae bacterium]
MTATTTNFLGPHVSAIEVEPAGSQPLNAIDRVLLAVHKVLRSMGTSGFETQTLVWTGRRIDAVRLRRAMARLGRRYPVITSRLAEPADGPPQWSFQDAAPHLREVDLRDGDDDAVQRYAAAALSRPRDLSADDPITFELLRRPDGRDVFLLQANHALMDYGATAPLIRRIDLLSQDRPHEEDDAAERYSDCIAAHLARFPRRRRIASALRAIDLRLRILRGDAVRIGRPAPPVEKGGADRPTPYALLSRSLEPPESRDLQQRVARTCGFPGVSMAVLAMAFRSLSELAPADARAGKYVTGIGLDLGLRNGGEPLFQNACSVVPVGVPAEMLEDRDGLVRALNQQLRDHLKRGIDLGIVQLASLFGRRSATVNRSARKRLERGYSLLYASFGSFDSVGESFCGSPIEHISCAGPAWPPLGLTLLVTQFRGRMHFQATCHAESVPATLGERFLDRVLDDLAEFRAVP